MFLLKQGRTVLVTILGMMILLPDLYIQPAQAEGEVQLDAQPKAQPEAADQPAPQPKGRLFCYACEPCHSHTHLGNEKQCHPLDEYCAWGEHKHPDGRKTSFRTCANPSLANQFSCDKFTPGIQFPDDEFRVCTCKRDLCNDKSTAGSAGPGPGGPGPGGPGPGGPAGKGGSCSSSAQLIFFRTLVAVSVFGCLMMK